MSDNDVCDSINHCSDGSDEDGCIEITAPTPATAGASSANYTGLTALNNNIIIYYEHCV